MSSERTPLLARGHSYSPSGPSYENPHDQFCQIVGIPPSNSTDKKRKISPQSLYGRATHQFNNARALNAFIAALSTTALLAQVVIGAAVTALGASQSSHILITVFGATNTVIAGIVAYLKSRGQPMRTRMFRDDLERVVEEIENSETMWLGITNGVHGYDDIDVGDKVTVRSEVARLMRLYERAMRNNVLNNPDNYLLANADGAGTALRSRTAGGGQAVPIIAAVGPGSSAANPAAPIVAQQPAAAATAPVPPVAEDDPDESPVSAPKKPASPPSVVVPEPAKSETPAAPKPEAKVDESTDKPEDKPKAAADPAPTATGPAASTSAPAPVIPTPTPAPAPASAPPVILPSQPSPEDDPDESPVTSVRPRKSTSNGKVTGPQPTESSTQAAPAPSQTPATAPSGSPAANSKNT
jgi:SMODS and SLOG-associating 2TM effector domain